MLRFGGKIKVFWYFTQILLALFLVLNICYGVRGAWNSLALPSQIAVGVEMEKGWKGQLAAQHQSRGNTSPGKGDTCLSHQQCPVLCPSLGCA